MAALHPPPGHRPRTSPPTTLASHLAIPPDLAGTRSRHALDDTVTTATPRRPPSRHVNGTSYRAGAARDRIQPDAGSRARSRHGSGPGGEHRHLRAIARSSSPASPARTATAVYARATGSDYFTWLDHVWPAAGCTHPIRLHGTSASSTPRTGELLRHRLHRRPCPTR